MLALDVCAQVLWELLTGEVPFKGLEAQQIIWAVVVQNEVLARCHYHCHCPSNVAEGSLAHLRVQYGTSQCFVCVLDSC